MSDRSSRNDPTGPVPILDDAEARTRLLDYWDVLVRRRHLFLTCLVTVVASTMVLTLLTTPTYRATTTLKIERQGPEILEFTDVLGVDPMGYHNFYATQYGIMQSRTVLRLAAERLDLINRPEFVSRKGSPLGRLYRWGRSQFAEPAEPGDPLDPAIEFISASLGVSPVRNSYLVEVTFTDRDAQLAADVVNAIADAYQQVQLDNRYTTTGKAKEFLAKDVARVQSEIAELQRRLQAYGVEKEILSLSVGSQDISAQALADINARLTDAKGRLAAAEARLSSVRHAPPEALAEVLNSTVINHLRERYAELERLASQMGERFNPEWPPLVELNEELEKAREQLAREAEEIASKVRAVAEADHERARAEVEGLERQWETQKREVQRVNQDTIEYAGLLAEIETKQKVLGDLVERQSETETSYRLKETSTSNVHIVDRASAPSHPVSPRKLFNLALSILLGTGLGIGAAFLFDFLDNTVKSEHDVQRVAKLAVLGHIPLTRSLRVVEERAEPAEDLTHELDLASQLHPRSGFSEAFRNLRTALLLSAADHPPRYVAVTSCEPGEGKSTIALNLAIVLTQFGRRVLLVDADLRRPRLHKTLGLSNATGLSSQLSGNAPLEGLLQQTEIPDLSVTTSGPIPPNPSELLGSPGLQTLIEHFGDRFDHILFDCPPVVSVTDAIILSDRVDSTILVVRAGSTSREALAQSLARLQRSGAHVVGTVLNAVSERSGYYYGRYGLGRGRKSYADGDPGQDDTPPTRRSRWKRHAG
jgi:capsular exopolysaccharide synthesis family protein